MTPDVNTFLVFAIKRGIVEKGRIDFDGIINLTRDKNKYLYCTKQLKDLVKTYSGGTPAKNEDSYWGGDIPWVSPKDFSDFYIYSSIDKITVDGLKNSSTKMVKPNSVIVVVRSGVLLHTLPIAVNKVPIAINQDIKALVPNSEILPEYLAYFISIFSEKILRIVVKNSTTVQSINSNEFDRLEIPIPPREVQKKLIGILDRALELRNQKVVEADQLLSGVCDIPLKLLGIAIDSDEKNERNFAVHHKDILGRLDADFYSPKFMKLRRRIKEAAYESVCVKDICIDVRSGFAAGKQDQVEDEDNGNGIPHLRPFSITQFGELSFETQKFVPKDSLGYQDYCKRGEVLFNNTNSAEWVGKTTVFDIDAECAVSNHITRLTLRDGINPYYIAAFFNALRQIGYWKLLSTYFNNQAGINTETLKAVKILLPPLDLQNRIADEVILRRSEAKKLKMVAKQDYSEAVKKFELAILGDNA
jgi:type I restriction enzyme S subunit